MNQTPAQLKAEILRLTREYSALTHGANRVGALKSATIRYIKFEEPDEYQALEQGSVPLGRERAGERPHDGGQEGAGAIFGLARLGEVAERHRVAGMGIVQILKQLFRSRHKDTLVCIPHEVHEQAQSALPYMGLQVSDYSLIYCA